MSAADLTPSAITEAVIAVLGGAPLDQVVSTTGIASGQLDDAVRTYHQAGEAALHELAARDWYQASLEIPPTSSIEHILATRLAPELQHAQQTGAITSWWFMRKAPGLRLRITPSSTAPALAPFLDELTTTGKLTTWRRTLYEPEEAVFGGSQAMDIAHELFAADSRHITNYVQHPQPALGRRELSILLCTALFRAAGQEWFECGDIWHRVAGYRPNPNTTDQSDRLSDQLHTLLSHDPSPSGPLFGSNGPLRMFGTWVVAFHHTGRTLADASRRGYLQRGLRNVLAHHVIFHWNRLGLNTRTQGLLARTAASHILDTATPSP